MAEASRDPEMMVVAEEAWRDRTYTSDISHEPAVEKGEEQLTS
jgi:hypothetical protein